MNFSCLDKDEKTLGHINLYIDAMCKNVNPCSVDMFIERNEIELHVKGAETSNEIVIEWIKQHSINIRSYFNSLRVFAIILYKKYGRQISYDEYQEESVYIEEIRKWLETLCD